MDKGWIKVHRRLLDHWLWDTGDTFSKNAAWVDLLLSVNYKKNGFYFDGEIVECDKGEMITSETKLSERWKWSRSKVRTFLNLLQKDNMIEKVSKDKRYTTIKICNFKTYQDTKTTKEQVKNKSETSEEQVKDINKESKKVRKKEPNIAFSEFWDAYGKKVGSKKKAESKWNKLTGSEREYIMDNIQNYVESFEDKQYQPYPTTFLNGKNWEAEDFIKDDSKSVQIDMRRFY